VYAIECSELTKKYGKNLALDHLNLKIKEDSIFGFLGSNGAGKTTTIKLICGLLKPTEGCAFIEGGDVSKEDARRIMGYLSEEPSFYGWMDGNEFLTYIGKLFKISPRERKDKIRELAELMQMEDALKKKISKYSKGMKQRLGIMTALINDPSVLILDEPCADLDPLGRMRILENISKSGKTVFFSSHILSDIEKVADDVAIIQEGKLLIHMKLDDLKRMFITPVIDMTFEKGISTFEETAQKCTWVREMEREGQTLRIFSRDIEESKKDLPRLIYETKSVITRYEILSPELEDIFKRIVEGESHD
jgi:ABC-2 type transport system ATP-binding protein